MLTHFLPLAIALASEFVQAPDPMTQAAVSRSPGAIIVATPESFAKALRLADKLADGGVTVLVRRFTPGTSTDEMLTETRSAIDSLRRRTDIRTDRIGVVTVGDGIGAVPRLVADTTLAFVVAVHGATASADTSAIAEIAAYPAARIPTLILQSHTLAVDTIATVNVKTVSNANDAGVGLVLTVGENVTIWPIAKATLANLSAPLEPMIDRVVHWVRTQASALTPYQQPGQPRQLEALVVH